jgi:hypothetical protein
VRIADRVEGARSQSGAGQGDALQVPTPCAGGCGRDMVQGIGVG